MKGKAFALLALAAAGIMPATSMAASASPLTRGDAPSVPLDTVVFAGGCFWGVQAVFQHVKGVLTATSGYAGGSVANPSYEQVSTGRTGNAESVRVIFDPAQVSYATLLKVFFDVAHDATQLNRQGPDVGTQYRSAVFYMNGAQRAQTLQYIAWLQQSGAVKGRIVTEVAPLKSFYTAAPYHQDYATLHPYEPYIRYNDLPKIAQLKARYPQLWSERLAAY
ncbi:MAG TPA: peptide-methionine (S)-S-oxide reductase MsrA [Gemmatimonadaceae bacterium]|nr:peptide-methionine (S)-S-oxide reductase MsrA [Gemmatimonadaceae bacterium]